MAHDLAKSGCDILRTFKELSPLTRPLGLFPSANSLLSLRGRQFLLAAAKGSFG